MLGRLNLVLQFKQGLRRALLVGKNIANAGHYLGLLALKLQLLHHGRKAVFHKATHAIEFLLNKAKLVAAVLLCSL